MSGDARDVSVSDLPEPVSDWLAQVAAEQGLSEEELLSRLLRTSTDGDTPDPAELDDRLDEIRSDLDGMGDRIGELEADTTEKIEDVRERVIQVKRDADEKADPDHDHPDLESEIADIDDDVAVLFQELDDVEENLEAAVEEAAAETAAVREEVEDASEKLTALAVAVVEMRDQVRELLSERRKRALTAELRTDANRSGVRSATCESCESGVEISLLTEPRCPHCSEPFEELDPKDGFFGTNYLRTGHAPALEPGEAGDGDSELEDIIEE